AGFAYHQFGAASGADLRFVSSDFSQELNYEVDVWNTNGTSLVWVQVPELVDSNTAIYALWGNALSSNAPLYTFNGAAWSAPYEAVWHLNETVMDEGLTGMHLDSTGFRRDGSQNGNVNVPGFVGGGQAFDGNDLIDFGPFQLTGDRLTMSAWFKPVVGAPNGTLIGQSHLGTHANPFYKWILYYNGAADTPHVRIDSNAINGPGNIVIENTWNQMAAVYDGTIVRLYLNGNEVASVPKTGNLQPGTQPVRAGGRAATPLAEYFLGDLDEIRLATGARSADWIWASWLNAASNLTFVCYDAPVPLDLTLTKTVSQTNLPAGSTNLTYSIQVMNLSTVLVGGIVVTDSVPTDV
ncbi:MAG: DUF2341 domain-containing protein, partial [Verrucomicrobiota bacterium]